jgi:predicted GIY-YIG superfamily endonuclease
MCCFEFISLMIPLRTLDPILQSIQLITRKTPEELTANGPVLEHEFKSKILQYCTFFPDYDSLKGKYKSNELIYCYPRHDDCILMEHAILKEVKQMLTKNCEKYLIRRADDFERIYMQTELSSASIPTSNALDKHGPSRELVFYIGAAFEITFNDVNSKFFKGQLCIVLDLPDKHDLLAFKSIKLLRAPPGTDTLPPTPYDKNALIGEGWEEVLIGKERPDKHYKIGRKGLAGYRRQYGLKHWISITIHGIMGATVDKLVTRLDNLQNKGLWEAAMVVVLLSRTRYAKDLIFIGDPQRTVDALWNTLLTGGKYNEITQYVLDCLIARENQPNHVLKLPLIRKKFGQLPTLLPEKGSFVVYLLVSTKDPDSTYVGHTSNMRKRLNKHNSYNGGSYGTNIDHSNLAPFGLLAMVVGFEAKVQARSFEQIWKNQIDLRRRNTKGKISSMTLMHLANPLILQNVHEQDGTLHLIECGYIKEIPETII